MTGTGSSEVKHTVAYQEKNQAAASSVLAAIGLTTLKIVVGVLTGSLGILAEAAHSALDLAAALMTWFAVRISGKPPDRTHPYGHGKAENLSALFETLLLLATCVWVVYSAIARLIHGRIEIEVTVWSFGVMALSIVVDYSRSRMLSAAAKKHDSRALEADALHFSTDIWSSAVVIVGLACVKLSELYPALAVLKRADAIAALIVAGIVFFVSGQLGLRTVQGLLDAAPKGLEERIKTAAESVPRHRRLPPGAGALLRRAVLRRRPRAGRRRHEPGTGPRPDRGGRNGDSEHRARRRCHRACRAGSYPGVLARMLHQQSAAARDRAASTSLRWAQGAPPVLNVLPSTPAGGSGRAPRICNPLIAPRSDRGATSGLATCTRWEVRGRDGSGGGAAGPARRGGARLELGHCRCGGEKWLNKAEFDTSVEKC